LFKDHAKLFKELAKLFKDLAKLFREHVRFRKWTPPINNIISGGVHLTTEEINQNLVLTKKA
jgi:hypothetical protein